MNLFANNLKFIQISAKSNFLILSTHPEIKKATQNEFSSSLLSSTFAHVRVAMFESPARLIQDTSPVIISRTSRGWRLSNLHFNQHWKAVAIGKLYFSRKTWKWKFIFSAVSASCKGKRFAWEVDLARIVGRRSKVVEIPSRVDPRNIKFDSKDPAQDDLVSSLLAVFVRACQRLDCTCHAWRVGGVNRVRNSGQWQLN